MMKAVVVRHIRRKWMSPNQEIIDLAQAAAYQIVEEINFYGEYSQPQTFLPEMKLQDLLFVINENKAQKIIIDGKIKPWQMLELERITELEIIDKPMLVLEIFSNKANSIDIQLQIQLAQLKYSIPRTVSKLGESVRSERPGFGGTGEQVTELLISDIKKRVKQLEKKLETYKHKQKKKENHLSPILPIIGYYSAGKSTLFNILTDNTRETGDEAFTTMILKKSRTEITGYAIDLIDTIGLVDLPSEILNAFDLMLNSIFSFPGLIICLDSSLPLDQCKEQIIELENYYINFTSHVKPRIIIAFTKIDLIDNERLHSMKKEIHKHEWLGIYRILEVRKDQPELVKKNFITVFEELFHDEIVYHCFNDINPSKASKIYDVTRVESQEWLKNGNTTLTVVAPKNVIEKLVGDFNT